MQRVDDPLLRHGAFDLLHQLPILEEEQRRDALHPIGDRRACGKAGAPSDERRGVGSFTRLINRALVDDLAVVHVQLARVHGVPPGDGLHMEVLDPMKVGQRKGKPFSLFGCDKFIDIDGMNGLITRLIATTVAKRLPASGETGQKDVSHNGPPS